MLADQVHHPNFYRALRGKRRRAIVGFRNAWEAAYNAETLYDKMELQLRVDILTMNHPPSMDSREPWGKLERQEYGLFYLTVRL